MSYYELSVEERSGIQVGLLRGMSQRVIARMLNRSPSTISREIRRNRDAQGEYTTQRAQQTMRERRTPCRLRQKLAPGNELFELVVLLRKRFQLAQTASRSTFDRNLLPITALPQVLPFFVDRLAERVGSPLSGATLGQPVTRQACLSRATLPALSPRCAKS